MDSIKFENKNLPVYFFKEDETTEEILALCEHLKEGKMVDVNGQIYQYANLPEFLVVVRKIKGVDFDKVCKKCKTNLQEILNVRVKYLGEILKR